MQKLKIFSFLLLMLLLWVPVIQQLSGVFKEPQLKGAYTIPPKPVFSIDSLKTMQYQKGLEDYLNFKFGFRSFFVKLKNTIQFSLFHEFNDKDLVWGKDGYIYSYGAIARSAGTAYEGKQRNAAAVSKINFLKEAIEKHGGHLITVIAPSKESVMPEFLPDSLKNIQRPQSDYRDFLEGYKKYKIPFIDFTPYFQKIKDTSAYPLFTKTGFHWSSYGAGIAEDTILKFIQSYLPKPMPENILTGVELSDTARYMDADYEDPMNLLYSLNQRSYAYPKLEIKKSSENNYHPKIIVVSDSYFNQVRSLNTFGRVFSEDSRFWYYFATSFPIAGYNGTPIKNVDVVKELESADVVLLLCYTGNLCKFPFGVADYYFNAKQGLDVNTIVGDNIKNTSSRIKDITAEAASKHISVDGLVAEKAAQICEKIQTIQLRADNNKFVCADGAHGNIIIADKEKASTWETFSFIPIDNTTCAIYGYNHLFLSAQLHNKNEVTATVDYIGAWETFTYVKSADGYISLKAANGKYLSLDAKTFQLMATAGVIGKTEKFRLLEVAAQ